MAVVGNGFKSAFAIQAVNSFVIGAVYVLVPLLMLDRGISIESMGLIFATLPLIAQSIRLVFGCVSDYIGRKKFYWVNGVMNVAFLLSYYFAKSPLGFLVGKMNEGVRDAALWSVNRAYLMDHTDHDHEKEKILIRMRGFGAVFESLGTMMAGFLISLLFYENTILLMIGISLICLPNVAMLKDKIRKRSVSVGDEGEDRLSFKAVARSFDIRHKSRKFKNFVVIFLILGLSWGFISGYILPLFLRESGIPLESIGLLLGARVLFNGLSMYVFQSIWSGRRRVIVGGLMFSVMIAMLSFSSQTFSSQAVLPMVIVLLGFVGGIADAGYETVFVSITDHQSLGRDIGFLMVGVHVGMSLSQAVSGFVITSLGFPNLFFMSAMLFVLFTLASYHNMR